MCESWPCDRDVTLQLWFEAMKECSGKIAATYAALLSMLACSSVGRTASVTNVQIQLIYIKIILPRLVWSGENFGYKQHEVIAMSFKHVRTKMLKLLSAVMGCVFLQWRIICYRQFFDYRFVKGAMIRSSSYSQFIVTDSIGANTVMRTHKKNFSQCTLTAH